MKSLRSYMLFIICLASVVINSLTNCDTSQVKTKTDKSSIEIVLKMKLKTVLEEGLALELNSFGHKRPMLGGPTKATAYLTVSKGNITEEISLSKHGIQGKTGNKEYDSLDWNGYIFELKEMNYNESIRVKIIKIP